MVTFGTTEKLNIPVIEEVKNLYKPVLSDGINLIQLDLTEPAMIVEIKSMPDVTAVLTVVCLINIETKIARAI